MKPPKILIVYAMFGNGHYEVTQALRQQLLETGAADVRTVDLFAEAHPALNALCTEAYRAINAVLPALYGWSYEWTKDMRANGPFARWLHAFGAGRLRAILREEQPDAVIHTFPFLAMQELKRAAGSRTPSFTVITDYVLHNRWLHPLTDGYFVATEALKEELLRRKVRGDRIAVTGIPLRSAFAAPPELQRLRLKYGLESSRPYVLIMAGTDTLRKAADELIRELRREGGEWRFLLVAGRSERLAGELKARYADSADVRVYGFLKDIQEVMALSACIVTKAGGVTLAEAMALGVPVVAYRPLPGQERGNAEYWAALGGLRIARRPGELSAAVRQSVRACGGEAQPLPDTPQLPAARAVIDEVLKRIGRADYAASHRSAPAALPIRHEYS